MIKICLPGKNFKTIILVFFLANLYACNRDRNNPGWDYFPDMFYSTAYETYSKNPNFENGMTMRVPVAGTVPRDFTPFEYTSGLYPLKPLTLAGESAVKLRDGEIFHTITLGIRSMGAHGSQIRPEDRWKLIIYIRKLQEEGNKANLSPK